MSKLPIPKEFQTVVERHGQELYELTMRTGAINYGFALIAQQAGGNAIIGQAIQSIAGNQLGIAEEALKGMGKTLKDLMACRADVERLVELAAGKIELNQTAGGIIAH